MNLKSAHTGKIGKIFINERIRRSFSEIQVAEKALINIEYIKAIESGDYSIFPARTYALQYFEKYAKFLGIEVSFFDIYSAEVVAQAERDSMPKNISKPFLEENKISTSIIILLILLIIIFLFISDDDSTKINPILMKEIEFNEALNANIEVGVTSNSGTIELHNEIDCFLNQDKLDSNEVSANVGRIDPTS